MAGTAMAAAAVSGAECICSFPNSQYTLSIAFTLFSKKNMFANVRCSSCLSYIFYFLRKLDHIKGTVSIPTLSCPQITGKQHAF